MSNDDGIEQMHQDLRVLHMAIDEILIECKHLPDGSWAIPDGDGLRLCSPALCHALDDALRATVYHGLPSVYQSLPQGGGR